MMSEIASQCCFFKESRDFVSFSVMSILFISLVFLADPEAVQILVTGKPPNGESYDVGKVKII